MTTSRSTGDMPGGRPAVLLEERANSRLGLIRRAAIYIPAAVVLTGLLLTSLMYLPGSIIAVILLAMGALAVDMEAYQTAMDLRSGEPVRSRGRVIRRWKKSRILLIGRVHYLLLEARPVRDGVMDEQAAPKRRLFEIRAATALEVDPGDELDVVHWEHTNLVASLSRVRRAAEVPLRRPASEAERA